MCRQPKPGEKVVAVRCQPKSYPCPTCGQRGHRKRRLDRFVRSLDWGKPLWLHVFYAEYTARCDCRKSFRSFPAGIIPKADYDNLVRQAVLDRLLEDGLNVERTLACMNRDFLLDLSSGFIYDCLDWGLTRLGEAQQRRLALEHFSGVVCIDELHLGDSTLLLATDPIGDRVLGWSLVRINDQAHMRRFLLRLAYWGFQPKVVVTDGSNLYPAVLAEVWPAAKHQLCVFHVLQDVNNKVLAAVRRLRGAKARRGNGGRKRPRGRPTEKQKRQARRRGPTAKEKSAFVFKHRFLIVKRAENLTSKDWDNLCQMFRYLPELRPLRQFCQDVYQLFNAEQVVRLARRRRTLLLKQASYQEVPELVKAMGLLHEEKFDKMIAFLECPAGTQVRTNNHVERTNRKLRFDEKVRYKWRSRPSLDRFLRLRLGRLGRQPVRPTPGANADAKTPSRSAPIPG
jgi:Transposase